MLLPIRFGRPMNAVRPSRRSLSRSALRPRLEGLEPRRLLAVSYVNDDWKLLTDNAPAGLSSGDVVRNDFDVVDPATITATYGVDAYGTVKLLTENWDDGNDTGWSRYSPFTPFGFPASFDFVASSQGGLGLRIEAPASPNPGALGATRAGDARPEVYTDSTASVDIVDWNTVLDQTFGLLVRVSAVGLGTTDGYVVNYNLDGAFQINRIDNEAPTTIAETPVAITAGHDYRIVSITEGTQITGLLFDLNDPSTPIATVSATDGTYPTGQAGVFIFDNSSGGAAIADATFDNFSVTASLPGFAGINDALAGAGVGDSVLVLDGTYAENVTVDTPATLGGSANINGSIAVVNGFATLAPGLSPGLIATGALTMVTGSTYAVELNGLSAGTEHDALIATGAVSISGAVLDVTLGFVPSSGNEFAILINDTANPISGEFAGLIEGQMFLVGTHPFTISYMGGDGNDIVLTATGASIPGRHIFYNNSAFDGNNSAANAADDGALATDKAALLPGGTATFANYTSFSKGITGIMVDVIGLQGTPTAADFAFTTGNNNTLGSWVPLGVAPTISVRAGAGVNGSDRVSLTWPDGTIAKKWLQVTMLATATTGLGADDVFYFGNAVGESGDTMTNAAVNATDEIGARANPRSALVNPAPVDFRWDYNRDKAVNSTDQLIARTNTTTLANRLVLIVPTPGGGGGGALAQAADGGGTGGESTSGRRRRR